MVIIQLSLLSNAIRHIKPAKYEYFNPDLLKDQNTHTHWHTHTQFQKNRLKLKKLYTVNRQIITVLFNDKSNIPNVSSYKLNLEIRFSEKKLSAWHIDWK